MYIIYVHTYTYMVKSLDNLNINRQIDNLAQCYLGNWITVLHYFAYKVELLGIDFNVSSSVTSSTCIALFSSPLILGSFTSVMLERNPTQMVWIAATLRSQWSLCLWSQEKLHHLIENQLPSTYSASGNILFSFLNTIIVSLRIWLLNYWILLNGT